MIIVRSEVNVRAYIYVYDVSVFSSLCISLSVLLLFLLPFIFSLKSQLVAYQMPMLAEANSLLLTYSNAFRKVIALIYDIARKPFRSHKTFAFIIFASLDLTFLLLHFDAVTCYKFYVVCM